MMIQDKDFGSYPCQNFPKCEQCIVNLLSQYLLHKDKNELKFSQFQQRLTQFKQVFAQLGVMIVTPQGQTQFISQKGETLINQYFGLYNSDSLPESLQYWLKHQISLLASNKQVSQSCVSLHIEQAGKQLLVSLIDTLIPEQYLLLLEEKELPSFSILSLELLGLTQREAQVLFGVAKDQSNLIIARKLDCSQGTVRKHLEHIYQKLGVQTRTGAVMVALERLGLVCSY